MKQAIINYINVRAERIRPCKHNWELLAKVEAGNKLNPSYRWTEYTYRCTWCCESKKISTE